MSTKLVVKQVLGVSSRLKGCLLFSEDHHLAYIAGHQVVVLNTETKEQAFVPATASYQHQSLGFTALTVSPLKKILAVAERLESGNNAIVTFYDSRTLRKKRLLAYPELGSSEIRSLSFSDDGKFLVTQGGSPEWNLVLWNVEKGAKVLFTMKMSLSDENAVNCVSFCPWDPNVILVLGKGILRLFRYIEGGLRPMAISVRKEQANFISFCWLPNEQLVIGTEAGELLYLENFEIRGFINPNRNEHDDLYPVLCLHATSRGFLMGTYAGEIKVFERHEELKEKYALESSYVLPVDFGQVSEMALAADEQLVVGFSRHQLLSCSLSNLYASATNMNKEKEKERERDAHNSAHNNNNSSSSSTHGHGHTHTAIAAAESEDGQDGEAEDPKQAGTAGAAAAHNVSSTSGSSSVGIFEHLLTPFHLINGKGEGTITGIDVALWKQIVVTCGKDRTVRVWNPSDRKLELVKEFDEEPLSVSLHPSGIYLAIAFSDKIRICSLLLEEIYVVREIAARQVGFIKFSKGGQYLAAAIGTNCQIYNTLTGAPILTLRGHNNRIKNVLWQAFDSRLITIGSEGMVYSWELFPTLTKRTEHYPGTVPIFHGTGPQDGSVVYIVSHDKVLKELVFASPSNNSGSGGKPSTASVANNNGESGTSKDNGSGGDNAAAVTAPLSSLSLSLNSAHYEGVVKTNKAFEIPFPVAEMLFDETRRMLLIATVSEKAFDNPAHALSPCPILVAISSPSLGGSGPTPNLEQNVFHSSSLSALCLSYDGGTIISGDESGIIVLSEYESTAFAAASNTNNLVDAGAGAVTAAAKAMPKQRDGAAAFEFVEEVVIHKSDLESRKKQIAMLSQSVEELNKNNEHQMRLKELEHKDKLRDISEKFQFQLRSEKLKYEELEAEKASIEREFTRKTKALEEKHNDEINAIKLKYKTKQSSEENRHKILLQETEEAHRRWNEENEVLVASHQKYLQELQRDYDSKILYEQKLQRDLRAEKEKLSVVFDGMHDDTEVDGDREIAEMKIKYDAKLRAEEETAQQLITQHNAMNKNHEVLVKESTQQKIEIKRLKDRESRLYDQIHTLEKDIQSHKKEIREREETITDKEKRIFELKKKNQELEKFRFVLDYKIKELKLQIAPRENEINTMRKQIEEMNLELEQYSKSNLALNLMIDELKLKIEGIKGESSSQDERIAISERFLEKFRRDLQELWLLRHDQNAFKAATIKMYRVYVQEDVSPAVLGESSKQRDLEDPQQVYNRDREQMERSLDSLRRALKTDTLAHKRDLAKMMRESVVLTKELNTLRKNARNLQLQKKAIDQAGDLSSHATLMQLMALLGLQVKKSPGEIEREKEKQREEERARAFLHSTGDAHAHDIFEKEKIRPTRSGPSGPPQRSAALRSTSADGQVRKATSSRGTSSADQWEAWRALQIQFETMRKLEDEIGTICESLSMDPIPVIVAVDSKLVKW